MKIIDGYFKKPLLWDLFLSIAIGIIFFFLIQKKIIAYPKNEFILNSISDIANLSFSSTGFILTILTVLITFKANSKKKEKIDDYNSALDVFFNTILYSQTTYHLKNCIVSLIFIGLFGYTLKFLIPEQYRFYLFYFLVISVFILSLTLMRCLLILNKVLKLQNK